MHIFLKYRENTVQEENIVSLRRGVRADPESVCADPNVVAGLYGTAGGVLGEEVLKEDPVYLRGELGPTTAGESQATRYSLSSMEFAVTLNIYDRSGLAMQAIVA